MDKIFNKEDVLTCIDAEQVKLGTPGYFGNTLPDLITAITDHDCRSVRGVDQQEAYCFETCNDQRYILFLPLAKVNKPRTYRPLANIAELIDFLVPEYDADVYDSASNKKVIIKYKNAEILLGRTITLRHMHADDVTVKVIQNIDFHRDGNTSSTIYLNNESLDFLFDNYEILIDGEWLPFGVEE